MMMIIWDLANSNSQGAMQMAPFFFSSHNVFMKKLLTILIFFSSTAFAAPGNFGIGVLLGEPSALSGKYFMGNDAIDGGIAFGHNELVLFSDYLRHFPGKFGSQNAFISALNPYVGLGPIVAFADGDNDHHVVPNDDDDFGIGGRIPLGVEWTDKEIPIGVSLEIAPGAIILPDTNAFVQGGIAVRYYF